MPPPAFVLFGFTIGSPSKHWDGVDTIHEKAAEGYLGTLDAIICPDDFCYFSAAHDEFALGFENGISAGRAASDGTVQDRIISKRLVDSKYSMGFTNVGDAPGSRLLAFAAFASHVADDDTRVEGLLAAALNPSHNPIW